MGSGLEGAAKEIWRERSVDRLWCRLGCGRLGRRCLLDGGFGCSLWCLDLGCCDHKFMRSPQRCNGIDRPKLVFRPGFAILRRTLVLEMNTGKELWKGFGPLRPVALKTGRNCQIRSVMAAWHQMVSRRRSRRLAVGFKPHLDSAIGAMPGTVILPPRRRKTGGNERFEGFGECFCFHPAKVAGKVQTSG